MAPLSRRPSGTKSRLSPPAGIALPEHMAKAIICGADLVTVDIPALFLPWTAGCAANANGTNSVPSTWPASMRQYAKSRVVQPDGVVAQPAS